MDIVRILGVPVLLLALTASSCPPQREYICVTFNQFSQNQVEVTPFDVAGWTLLAMPLQGSSHYPRSFRFYDPANDGGPANHKGPEVYGEFQFTPPRGGRTYNEMTMEYVNDSTFAPVMRLLDTNSTQVATQTFAATPQNSALSAKMNASGFTHIHIKGGELIVGKVCVR